jgi:OOP family OmpA-OmpF porin
MKRTVAAAILAGAVSSAGAQAPAGEPYFGVLGNFLVSPDSSRELDGFGVQGLYGTQLYGWPVEYRAFYDKLEPQSSNSTLEFFRAGAGADLILGLTDLGMPDMGVIKPFVLGGAGVIYGDAVPGNESEFDVFANVGVGAMSAALTDSGWRIRGDLKYVYENLGEGYLDLHAALGLEIPLGAAAAYEVPVEPVKVVKAADETPVDSDGDGVLDGKDRCPGTRAGTEVQSDGCPVQAEPLAVLELKGVSFESNSDLLRDESIVVLDEAVATLNSKYPNTRVEVAGHTDSMGDDAYNLDLSRRRAEAVRQYLTQAGVDKKRLSAEGYGEAQPVADNGTAAGRHQNRRVELRVRE